MTMVHDGETSYETDTTVKRVIEKVIHEQGKTVISIGRWSLILDQVFVSFRTPKPPKPPKMKKHPPARAGAVPPANDAPEAEPEQAAAVARKPPHLIMCKWIKPPPSVQAHLQDAKLGRGLAQFLEVRSDLWALASERDREAAIMTKLLERAVVDTEDGDVRVRKADLPIQTHPAVQAAYGAWWENMDPESALERGGDDGDDSAT